MLLVRTAGGRKKVTMYCCCAHTMNQSYTVVQFSKDTCSDTDTDEMGRIARTARINQRTYLAKVPQLSRRNNVQRTPQISDKPFENNYSFKVCCRLLRLSSLFWYQVHTPRVGTVPTTKSLVGTCSVCLLHRESKIKVASKRRKADMRKKVVSRHIQIVSRHVKIVSNKKQQTTCTAHASSPTTIFEVLPCTQVIISNNHYTYS